ncbi:hypothetical protein [Staphylococcus intermedius]|uniref:Putative DNA binding protein n=1 Tax=Staphylococcus intermedius NCTC 11048 TaxID=1141106 RepID=A0A380G5T1_STAIN|nr:hypothetical protein [Staphylococcus intermedius]PCF64068.1 hypothetical protein B5C04_08820 [Staphylococcus intermedius]PCF79756.1 hypothetical protein B4W70_08810 [Staphylococcus intermedius]PCF85894.1 hypothetical protein B4W76_09125 [Staphylococcus intermedius]PCF89585.1 hypothetical protein B4W75_01735 [Staphylococcus intermedius]PNZ51299.1 hypothetical protein CD138_10020 [Staphylococcus intermedius NCTC 11048]
MNQHNRLLSIYTDLIAGKIVNKTELARDWEVSKRTIQRDIAHIRNFLYEHCEWLVLDNPIIYDSDNDSYYLKQNTKQTDEYHSAFLKLNKIEKQKIFVKFEVNNNIWKLISRKFVSQVCSTNEKVVIGSVYVTEEEALKMSFEYKGQIKLLEPETVKEKLIYEITLLHSLYQNEKSD